VRPVSAAFLETLRGSHTMTAQAKVLSTFQTGTDPTGTEVDIIDGSVVLDGAADVRSALDLTTDGTGLWPDQASDLFAPYGNEIFIRRGIEYGNGTIEWCSLGYFRIQTPEQDEPVDGPIRITGMDRMQAIIDGRLIAPIQFTAATTYGTVVSQLITAVYPSATIQWDDATDATAVGRALIAEETRFEFLDDLIASVGKIWYWDHRGILVITAPPSTTTPVWEVNAGQDGVLVSSSRKLSREGVFNAVVASGEATDTATPARAVAIDNNPASPTYYYGRFGPVPRYYTSPFLTTDAQALSAAQSLLQQNLGLPYNVEFKSSPNPALEPYDPVQIRFATSTGTEIHVCDRITIPLTEREPLTVTTREQTTVLIGHL